MQGKVLVMSLCLSTMVVSNPTKVQDSKNLDVMESKLTEAMDELNNKESIEIYGNMISLKKVSVDEEKYKEVKADQDPLMSKIDEFLRCRKLQLRFPDDGSPADLFGRALGEKKIDIQLQRLTRGASEARTKLKRIILPLLLALKLKALIVLPIVITIIGLIGINGLGAGLMALLISGAVALKSLLTPPPPLSARVSYGIVKPHDIHHDHWHRSQEEINQPYRGWSPDYPVDQYPYPEVS